MLNKILITLFVTTISLVSSLEIHAQVLETVTEAGYSPQRGGPLDFNTVINTRIQHRSFYDENGNMIEFQQYNGKDRLTSKTLYTLTADGQVATSEEFDNQGVRTKYNVSEFDQDNNLVAIEKFDDQNILQTTIANEYDANGNIIKTTTTDVSSNKSRITENTYDVQNRLTAAIDFDFEGTIKEQRTFTYDLQGNVIESTINRWNKANNRYVGNIFAYDSNNNVINQKRFDTDGNLISEDNFSYNYNTNGDWIKMERRVGGEMREIACRQLAYH